MDNQFSIGERVIALSNPPNDKCQKREKGKIYIVKDILYCSKCGVQSINLGNLARRELAKTMTCFHCKNKFLHQGLQWTFSSEFAKIDHSSLKHAVEEEDYELACIIRDNLKP